MAVTGSSNQSGVILNPERRVRIGECVSLFVICNNVEETLSMLQTENLKSVMRMLRSKREYGITSPQGLPTDLLLTSEQNSSSLPMKDFTERKRAHSSVITSMDHHLPDVTNPITFKRHSCCYAKELTKETREKDNLRKAAAVSSCRSL